MLLENILLRLQAFLLWQTSTQQLCLCDYQLRRVSNQSSSSGRRSERSSTSAWKQQHRINNQIPSLTQLFTRSIGKQRLRRISFPCCDDQLIYWLVDVFVTIGTRHWDGKALVDIRLGCSVHNFRCIDQFDSVPEAGFGAQGLIGTKTQHPYKCQFSDFSQS